MTYEVIYQDVRGQEAHRVRADDPIDAMVRGEKSLRGKLGHPIVAIDAYDVSVGIGDSR